MAGVSLQGGIFLAVEPTEPPWVFSAPARVRIPAAVGTINAFKPDEAGRTLELELRGNLAAMKEAIVQTKEVVGNRRPPRCQYLWLRGRDLNPRPLGYEPNELPDCSTPRQEL